MGIRFFCPNGHKLNVKVHLAGKTGFCPECGARLVIPLKSTRKSSKELREEALRQQPATTEAEPATEPKPEVTVPSQAKSSDNSVGTPVLQDQTLVWYVQVPAGPQYGPVSGAVMQSWLQQHRVSADMLVWREDWETWQEARQVFPELD